MLRDAGGGEAGIPSAIGQDCMALLLGRCGSKGEIGDKVVSTLLQRSAGARSYLASQLEAATTDIIFKQLWDTGEMTTHELVTLLLDVPVWSSDEARYRCERDVFMLLLAKSMEAGMDQPGRVLEQLSRLLAVDTERLHPVFDADSLSGILSCLDVRRPAELRRQATVVTARYLAVAQETGQQLLAGFVASRVAVPTNDNLVIAFSTAAVVFPIAPGVATRLFLADGFASSLLPLLVKKAKTTRIRQTALEMLSAACADAASREIIVKYFAGWVEEQMVSGPEAVVGAAAVILAKLGVADASRATTTTTTTTAAATAEHRSDDNKKAESALRQLDMAAVVAKLKELSRSSDASSRQRAVEGLAYTSLQPAVKQSLAGDAAFLRRLAETILTSSSASQPALLFGALSVLANLTHYLPNLSDEQKRMLQLKAYADTSKAQIEPDLADRDDAVTQRCAAVLQAGVVPVLAPLASKLSLPALALALSVVLSLAREQKHRGSLAQQGAVRMLLQSYARVTGAAASDREARFLAAHALARILISVDPNLLFAGSAAAAVLPISSAVAPLVSLLFFAVDDGDSLGTAVGILPSNAAVAATSGDQRDLLPTFEALMALTNLASTPDDAVRALIVRKAWVAIEDLLLSHNTLIQRAAVELICNLMLSPECVSKFVAVPSGGGSSSSSNSGVNGSGNASVAADTHGKGGDGNNNHETAAGDEAELAAQAARCHNRLRILLALADADDAATRRAAAGALGMLAESEDPPASATVAALLRHAMAVPLILRLCQDEDESIAVRAVVCLRCIVLHTGSVSTVVDDRDTNGDSTPATTDSTTAAASTADGAQVVDGDGTQSADVTSSTTTAAAAAADGTAVTAQDLVKRHGGVDVLQKFLLRTKYESIVSVAIDALKALVSAPESLNPPPPPPTKQFRRPRFFFVFIYFI